MPARTGHKKNGKERERERDREREPKLEILFNTQSVTHPFHLIQQVPN